MEIIQNLIDMTATILEVFLILLFTNRFLNLRYFKNHAKGQFLSAFIALSFYMVASQFLQNYIIKEYIGILDIIGMFLFLIYTVVFFEGKFLYKVLVPILSISFIMLINSLMVIIFKELFHISNDILLFEVSLPRIAVVFTGKILYFILSELILKFCKKKKTYLNNPETMLIGGIVIFSLIIMFELMKKMLSSSNNDVSLYILLLVSITFIDIFVFFALKLISDKNEKSIQYRMEKIKNENIINLYNSTKKIYNELQMLRHDMKNQMLVLYDYIENDDKEKAFAFIDNIVERRLKSFVTYVNTGSDIIDTVINIKLNIAREHNIEVECNICSDFKTNDNEKIVSLISNAIDNAIEASEKVENPKVIISIVDKGKYTDISVKNVICGSVLKNNKTLETSKNNKKMHGYGVNSMKKICSESNGLFEIYENSDTFVVHILFPKKK